MTDEWFICGMILLAVFAAFIPFIVWDLKKTAKRLPKEDGSVMEKESLNTDETIITTHAEIVDMVCGVNTIGYQSHRQPKAVKYFAIKFKNDDGDLLNVFVSEEMYLELEIGLSGMLTLIDGNLDSFELDDVTQK